MADSLGRLNPGTKLYIHGDGTDTDAALRVIRNRFNLSTDTDPAGGTSNRLYIGRLPQGCVPRSVRIMTDANCSAINLTVGTTASAAKYMASAAGPNATQSLPVMPIAAQMADALTAYEDVYVTPSGNWPASGQIAVSMDFSKR
jgi:hypothetical protein